MSTNSKQGKVHQKGVNDRKSGSGVAIKAQAIRDGSGKGNWGSNQENIEDAKNSLNDNNKKKNKKKNPKNMNDIIDDNEDENQKQTWDEYRKTQNLKKNKPMYIKSIDNTFKRRGKEKKTAAQKETDLLFAGEFKEGKKKSKQKKEKNR
mmetsp:Transcript_2810/g.3436  ORF Transcript_2810/g.3436 Transcript_2810/m.3436 type:complete len:149 (-) Transcript_2810:146-592(-)